MATRRRRFGRIRKLPSGRFQARYTTPDGKEHTGEQTFPTKTAADQYLSKIETDLGRGTWIDHRLGDQTIQSWGERFLKTNAHLKPSSRLSQDSLFRTVISPEFGKTPVGKLKPLAVREW